MTAIRLAATGLALSLTVVVSAGAARPITGDTLAAFESWVRAVKTHTPGRADAAVVAVAAFSYETREELNAGMPLFFAVLQGKKYVTGGNKAAQAIAALAHAAGTSFVTQAAVLHSDVAAHAERFPSPSTGVRKPAPSSTEELRMGSGLANPTKISRSQPVSPLLMENRIVLNKDGQVIGEVVATWNWPFARSLLDLLSARRGGAGIVGSDRYEAATDPFVSVWYRATTAYMFANGLYGEAAPHLRHAAEVLPDDAWALYDQGCYAEVLGLPMHQALLAGRGVPAAAIPSAEKTNAEAERLFRRALAIDPTLVEARVRLARLLDVRKRHQEADAELKTALASNPTGILGFYARLFAGRAARALERTNDASAHYRAALTLFPDAQSALLAASELALVESDVPAALAPVDRLGARSAVFAADPWWQYHLCSGRDAEDLLEALWRTVPR